MNFKSEEDAKRFLAIMAAVIIAVCLILALLAPNAQAQRPNKIQEKNYREYHKNYNRHVKKWKPCKSKHLHLPKPSRFGC